MENKYGICEWYMTGVGPFAIEMASKMGFDGIQITDNGGVEANFPLNDSRIVEMYRNASFEYNIKIQGFQAASLTRQGGIRYPIDSSEGQLALNIFKKGLEVCRSLSIPTYLVASFDKSNFRNDYEFKNTISMLKLMVALAQEEGVQIAYEPFCQIDKLEKILSEVGNGIRLCYDSLNPIRFGFGSPTQELERLGVQLIDHVHLKDAREDMFGCWPLGQGMGEVFETIQALKERGYQGWYFAENYFYLPPMSELGDGWDLALTDLEFMRKNC